MPHVQFSSYPGFGDQALERTHYNQAVRVGDIIEIAGQGGCLTDTTQYPPPFPPTTAAQIHQAFANVELALKTAGGAGWSQVYKVRAFIKKTGDAAEDGLVWGEIVKNLREWCREDKVRAPPLTAVYADLAFEEMVIEIEVSAYAGEK